MSTDIAVRTRPTIDEMKSVAKAHAMSGYWPDTRDVAQAFVKVSFGYEVGLPAYVAMSEVHIIQGKPALGAGALAALVKAHPNYDYRVTVHDGDRCALEFFQAGESVGVSEFSMQDAKDAGLTGNATYKKYPRNMLFARAMSNGVAWFCPDVTLGRVYTPDALDADFLDSGEFCAGRGSDTQGGGSPDIPAPTTAASDDEPVEDAEYVDVDESARSAGEGLERPGQAGNGPLWEGQGQFVAPTGTEETGVDDDVPF